MYCSLNKKKIFSEIIYFLNKNKNTKKKINRDIILINLKY